MLFLLSALSILDTPWIQMLKAFLVMFVTYRVSSHVKHNALTALEVLNNSAPFWEHLCF